MPRRHDHPHTHDIIPFADRSRSQRHGNHDIDDQQVWAEERRRPERMWSSPRGQRPGGLSRSSSSSSSSPAPRSDDEGLAPGQRAEERALAFIVHGRADITEPNAPIPDTRDLQPRSARHGSGRTAALLAVAAVIVGLIAAAIVFRELMLLAIAVLFVIPFLMLVSSPRPDDGPDVV